MEPKAAMTDVILKRLEQPDEIRTFKLGRFELVTLGGMTIGRATYLPGWRWSKDVGASVDKTHCTVEHIGLVISGHATAAMRDGTIHDLIAGTLFYIPAEPHDSWVVGDEPVRISAFFGCRCVCQKIGASLRSEAFGLRRTQGATTMSITERWIRAATRSHSALTSSA